MKDIQKFVWLLVAFALMAAVFPFLRDVYLARTYGSQELLPDVRASWEFVSYAVIGLQNVGAALWLSHEAKKNSVGQVAWAAFGLLFGLIAVGIFYLVRLNVQHEP